MQEAEVGASDSLGVFGFGCIDGGSPGKCHPLWRCFSGNLVLFLAARKNVIPGTVTVVVGTRNETILYQEMVVREGDCSSRRKRSSAVAGF